MPLINSVRKLFMRRRPLELSITHRATGTDGPHPMLLIDSEPPPLTLDPSTALPADPDEPLAVLNRIESVLEDDRDAHVGLRESVAHLPQAISSMNVLAERQQTLIEVTRSMADHHRTTVTMATQHAEHLRESLERQSDTMGLIQRQLDANHQVASHAAETLNQLGECLRTSTHTTQRTGEAMNALAQSLASHRNEQDASFQRLQGWMIATAIACIATVLASAGLGWVLLTQS
jgi:chromosome segregation ATPase